MSTQNAALHEKINKLERGSNALSNFMGFAVDTYAKGLYFVLTIKPHIQNGTFLVAEAKTMVQNCIQIPTSHDPEQSVNKTLMAMLD